MKALVKQYPINARYEYQNEVWEETRWTPMMNGEDLRPYTDENYGYALCLDCPDDVELKVEDFDVTSEVIVEPSGECDEQGEPIMVERTRWWATYKKGE